MADDTLKQRDLTSEGLENWLRQREDELGKDVARQLVVWFAARCASRVFPLVWESEDWSVILPVLRALTVTRVASSFPKTKILVTRVARVVDIADDIFNSRAIAAVDAAIQSITSDNLAIFSAADADAFYAAFVVNASFESRMASGNDLESLEQNNYQISENLPLWHGDKNEITKLFSGLKQDLQHRQETAWSFFLDDYDRQLAGQEPDWKVLKALAHPDATEVWQTNDPQQIADYIREIQEAEELPATEASAYYEPDPHNIPQSNLRSNPRSDPVLGPQSDLQTESHADQLEEIERQTPIGARIDINPDTGLIEETSLTDSIDLQVEHAFAEIEEALETLDDLGENMQALFKPIRRKLKRTLDSENRGANRLFSFVSKAHRQIIDICNEHGIGDPRDDSILNTTLRHLEEATTCLIFHEDVKPNIKPRIHAPTFHEALQIDNPDAGFHQSIKLFIAAAEPSLAQELKQDQDIIQNPDEDEESKKDAYYYLIGRLVRGLRVIGNKTLTVVTVLSSALVTLQNFVESQWGRGLVNLLFKLFTGR